MKESIRLILLRLGGVFLIAFLTNFPLTQAIIVNQDAAGFLIDHIIKNVLNYETHPYDRKVQKHLLII